jgi:hypothetical protein
MSQAGSIGNGGGGGGATTFVTDAGTATPVAGVINIIADVAAFQCGASVEFTGSGDTVELHLTSNDDFNNTFLGKLSGQFAGGGGESNVALGYGAASGNTAGFTGSHNVALGALSAFGFEDTSGCIAIGYQSMAAGAPGENNIAIGTFSASNWTGGEANNILISSAGVASEANTIRIGTEGSGDQQQNRCFIAGIDASTTGGASSVVIIDSSSELGTIGGGNVTLDSGSNSFEVNGGFNVSSTGVTTNTVQPAFSAYLNTSVANVTGDGTQYVPIIFDTVFFNQSSSYNTGTGVWTAPVTGVYHFSSTITLNGVGATHISANFCLQGLGSNLTFEIANPFSLNAFSGLATLSGSATVHVTSGTTIFMNIEVSGGTKTVGVLGLDAGQYFSQFSGYLVC